MLTKDDILIKRPLPYIDVHCETFRGTVRVGAMSAATRDIFEQRMAKVEEIEDGVQPNLRAVFLVHCIVDDKGALIFTMDDVELLGSQDAADIGGLFKKAQEVNGLLDSEEETKKK
ncbi:MAG: hypothetical protein KUG81_05765 [Gammaproteobacteria bacterium]|nr:hypothetical protein [Gammaproteobacteria bacterium]